MLKKRAENDYIHWIGPPPSATVLINSFFSRLLRLLYFDNQILFPLSSVLKETIQEFVHSEFIKRIQRSFLSFFDLDKLN